jgi:hypothetical protein
VKAKKTPSKLRSRRKKPAPARVANVAEKTADSARFLQDLATRGEAAELTKDGKLPSQATHVITKKNQDGTIEVKRARFKLV